MLGLGKPIVVDRLRVWALSMVTLVAKTASLILALFLGVVKSAEGKTFYECAMALCFSACLWITFSRRPGTDAESIPP